MKMESADAPMDHAPVVVPVVIALAVIVLAIYRGAYLMRGVVVANVGNRAGCVESTLYCHLRPPT
jgi:hypothetical protein